MDAEEFPSHRHPLKPIKEEDEESRVCGLCGDTFKGSGYQCSHCDFAAHLGCAKNPPPLKIEESKIHDHPLILLPTQVSFPCNACGVSGRGFYYVCVQCDFKVHKDCIDYPHVIRINRHDHCLSYTTSFLGSEKLTCGVCRHEMDVYCGGFICLRCEHYAVHSKCATRTDVWDRKELEGEPEEEDDHDQLSSEPFPETMSIQHFSHQHALLLQEGNTRADLCFGCSFPVDSEPFYSCQQCNFFLHKTCAYLPKKKHMFLHVHPLTLCADKRSGPTGLSHCDACELPFNGFSYRCFECKDKNIEFDIQCSSITDPVTLIDHEHPLYVTIPTNEIEKANICSCCGVEGSKHMLSCTECKFNICMACAALPLTVKYKYDQHWLTVNTGLKDVTSLYMCDICEKKLEGKDGKFFACFDCGPVLHSNCALGSFRHMRPGLSFTSPGGHEYQVILNDRTLQLFCSHCLDDCHEPLLLMSTTTTDVTIYLCSSRCFTAYDSLSLL